MAKAPATSPELEFLHGLRRRAGIAAGLGAVIFLALTWLLWHLSIQYLNLRLEEAVRSSSGQAIARVESFLDARMVALRRIAQFCQSSDNLMEPEFSSFTSLVLSDVPGILSVVRTDRAGVPVWQTPRSAISQDQLFLLTGDPALQQVLQNALAHRQFSITNAIEIRPRSTGFMVAVPIERAGLVDGFIIGIYTYMDLLNYLLDPELLQHYHVAITQAGRVIYPKYGGASQGFDTPMNRFGKAPPPYQTNKVMNIGGQEWEITVEPIDTPTTPQSVASLSILSLGLTLTLLISILSYRWVLRAGQLQAEAKMSRKRLEDTGVSLVEIKAELDLILNSVDEGIILYDANLRPLQANAPFLAMFGLGEGGAPAGGVGTGSAGLRQAHHVHMARRAGSESRYLALFRTLQRHPEHLYSDEIEVAAGENDSKRSFVRRGMGISGAAGERRGLMVIYKEITSLKDITRAKDEFLAGVTHELRSPLAAIKGFAETIRRDEEKMPVETRREFMGIICEETERLQNLIEELLDLRRMEASGGVALHATKYDLKSLTREIASSSRSMLLVKNINLKVEWSDEPDCRLTGDASQISRAIRNLVVNAIKYSPQKGEIVVRGRCGPKSAWIEVSDQGVGISEGDLPHIFDKFYRGKSKGGQKGTGLGLAIVKHIVELHGGHLGVRSVVGKGTTFHLELPRQFRPPSQALLGTEDTGPGTDSGIELAGSTSAIMRPPTTGGGGG